MSSTTLKLESEEAPCPICGSSARRLFWPFASNVISNAADFLVAKCRDCSFWYLHPTPKLTPEVLTHLYNANYFVHDPTNRGEWKDDLRHAKQDPNVLRWLSLLRSKKKTTGDKLLDIGCGRGVLIGVAQSLGWEVHGFDVTDTNRRLIFENCGVEVRVGERPTNHFEASSFDAIVCKDVLEHQSAPTDFLAELKDLLKPGGVIFLSFPNEDALMNKWIRCLRILRLSRTPPPTSMQPFQEPYHMIGFTERSFDFLTARLALHKIWSERRWGTDVFSRRTYVVPTSFRGKVFERTLYWSAWLGDRLNNGLYFHTILTKT